MTETQTEMVLLVEAPLDEAKLLREQMQAESLRVALVKPSDCGKKS